MKDADAGFDEGMKITNARLRVDVDPGHVGMSYDYSVEADGDGYKVTASVSRLYPARGSTALEHSHRTEVLAKDRQQVRAFLDRLAGEFDVFSWHDLKPSYAFLHPKFYTFRFQNASGTSHDFKYQIECDHHLDERYRGLVDAFEGFFGKGALFERFRDSRQPPVRPKKRWWNLW